MAASMKHIIFTFSHRNACVTRCLPCVALLAKCQQQQPVRWSTNKHWIPKWRRYRWAKFVELDLPDFDKLRRDSKMSPPEMRAKLKKDGRLPARNYSDREIVMSATNTVFEPFVPPEGDGLASVVSGKRVGHDCNKVSHMFKRGRLSPLRVGQEFEGLKMKGKSLQHSRKIRKFEDDFDTKTFPIQVQETYLKALRLINNAKDNEDELHDLVTEKAYPELTWGLDKRTVRWEFVGSLEPPRVVHVRTTDLLTKENLFAQVTVRFHTQQTLAVYDRFGRLLYGSEHLIKDCLDYVVFEKHISEEYGTWRVHSKIVPEWLPPKDTIIRTLRKPHFEPIVEDEKSDKTEVVKEQQNVATPAMAS